MSQIELLAPAKDLECGIAAIDCGADAVYIGATAFGARENASNDLRDIASLVQHAHRYWAKVYVTLNTLLRDEEIPDALELVSRLYDLGVDGLIIQDVGLIECDLPPIPLIASTQMHNNTPEKVAFLAQVGIKRVILARELDLGQIRAIRERTDVELEFFVHGALCVCYSGQCYLSYALGGRSGNRGQCAQPCRKLYTLVDANGKVLQRDKHLLSPRDLNLSEHLGELLDAGVCSFKIEGRLKDRTYVSNIVAYYRSKLDEAIAERGLERSSSGVTRVDFEPNPAKTFNRGFTTHFLHGRKAPIASIDTPKMVGEPIGRVISLDRKGFTLDSDAPIHRGDGISFFDRNQVLRGSTVNDVQGRTVFPDKLDGIEKGAQIYRNHDHESITRLEKSRPEREIRVSLALRETPDGLCLSAADEDGNHAESGLTCEKTLAERAEQALHSTRRQLAKMGGSGFTCTGVEVETAQVYFLPISALNSLRRGVLEALEIAREANRPRFTGGAIRNEVPCPVKALSFEGNVLNAKAEAFYRRHGVEEIEPAAESGLSLIGRRVMTTRYCIKHQLDLCPKDGHAEPLSEPLTLVNEEGRRLTLHFECGMLNAECGMTLVLGAECGMRGCAG